MKRFILIVAAVTFAFAAPVFAGQSDPHQEEADGCDHGATGKQCRPDPQPDKGKDCLVHGRHGGINEDHCAPQEVAPSTSTTTTTTVPKLTPPSTSTPAVDVKSPPPDVTTTPGPQLGPEVAPEPSDVPSATRSSATTPPLTELAATGSALGVLTFVGLGALLLGLLIWFQRSPRNPSN